MRPDLDPKRFEASKLTLLIDRFMNHFISLGGVTIIVVVFGIFLFIASQIFPLFQPAKAKFLESVQLPSESVYVLGAVDEYGELPFFATADGKIDFFDLVGDRGRIPKDYSFTGQEPQGEVTAVAYVDRDANMVVGTSLGQLGIVTVNWRPTYDRSNNRTMEGSVTAGNLLQVGQENLPVQKVSYGGGANNRLAVVSQKDATGRQLLFASLIEQRRGLVGAGEARVTARFDLSKDAPDEVDFLLVNRMADLIVAGSKSGVINVFARTQRAIELRQSFRPFEDMANSRLAKVEFLFGDASLMLASESGANRIFSLHEAAGDTVRRFHLTKTFPDLAKTPTVFAKSLRNKAFLLGNESTASLRFSTTESVRWEGLLPSVPTLALLGPKYDLAFFLTKDNRLEKLDIVDKHPEAGWRSFFGKVWYEGSNEPDFVWQSTGGSDDFEPKLSLIPLIFGTLKGTLYAMIFALPIALLSALYVSQFAHPDVRRVVKPTMEIMASLPSVVLGFLAALWLAPAIETRVPSILLIVLLVPASALLMGFLWQRLPSRARIWTQWGHEWWLFLPCLALVMVAGWMLGPLLERALFTVTDPSGLKIADFRRWWPEVTGTPFQQRNSLVVGFMMGFAVIPIIFTIAEDSLSNVPGALRSGSLALGASRWQTAINVILPTASPGIFSAVMIGLGRAVGETMIVVMATGNTPIMELNIFSGMRTLSANIAVELPEAAEGGTLYRTLFLGAMVLFLLTFSVNTVAEVLRQWLRERYKLV